MHAHHRWLTWIFCQLLFNYMSTKFFQRKIGQLLEFSCFLTRNYIIYCENNDMHISKASNWKDIFSLPQSVYDRFTDLTD